MWSRISLPFSVPLFAFMLVLKTHFFFFFCCFQIYFCTNLHIATFSQYTSQSFFLTPSFPLSIYLSIYLTLYLSFSLYISLYLCIYPYISLDIVRFPESHLHCSATPLLRINIIYTLLECSDHDKKSTVGHKIFPIKVESQPYSTAPLQSRQKGIHTELHLYNQDRKVSMQNCTFIIKANSQLCSTATL